MDVTFASDVERRLIEYAQHRGKTPEELVELAVLAMLDEVEDARTMLDIRYDAVRRGEVRLIPGEEVEARFAAKLKSAKRRLSL